MSDNIIGGVSPLKNKNARTYKRGGKHASKATQTSKQRGGFSRSKGVRGGGGSNVPGYNVNTRFSASQWTPPGSGGTYRPTFSSKPVDGGTVDLDKLLGTDERHVKNTETYVPEDYKPFWDKRIGDKSKWSKGMKQYLDGVDLNDPDAVQKAYDEWYKVSSDPKNVEARKKSREKRTNSSGYTEYRDYEIKDGKKTYTTDWYRK